jgi:hypothetical protein
MSLSINQIFAGSYTAVVNEMKKPANQWAESAFLRELDRQGGIKREDLGPTIEMTLDYQRNPGTVFQATDLQPLSLSATEVLTAASYSVAELTVPVVWSKKTEAQNPSQNQKVAIVRSLIENAVESHDDALEQAFFTTSTNGFLGIPTHITTAGTGSDGGIDSGTETFWRNQQSTYVDDTDIEQAFTTVWNASAKGSGSKLQPTLMVSNGATQALFEGTQQANQRYIDEQDLKAGFKILAFKTARYVFSQYGTATVFFMNPKNLMLVVSKQFFRDRGETQELPNANGYETKIYTALQFGTNNRSRLGCAHV